MRKIIKNNYKFVLGVIVGLLISVCSVYAIDAYIESNKVAYNNHNKENVQEALDELYEKSGIHKNKWIDPILNGADPVLKSPLIPVEIKNNGDVYYANENSEWYNYSEKRWANAVILVDEPSNENYQVGDHIKEDDIESYFVWIPRYQYKIWDLGNTYTSALTISELNNIGDGDTALWRLVGNNSRIIDIKFGTVDSLPKINENEAEVDIYYTHPAFTLGDKNLNGLWVGKFETGYKGANSIGTAQHNEIASDKIIIKPNVYSWREITIKNIFMSAYEYKKGNSNHNNVLDPHMMKNTEWGAVAYLSNSKYGIDKNINLNNNSNRITGYSVSENVIGIPFVNGYGTTNDITQTWNSTTGFLASTTGNITGVYDMSGGAWDYVAGCIKNNPGQSDFGVDELNNQIAGGYIDGYPEDSTKTSYNKGILGDATKELGPFYNYSEISGVYFEHSSWYANYGAFVEPTNPWFRRGGSIEDGVLAGQFYFGGFQGNADARLGFRISLAVTK